MIIELEQPTLGELYNPPHSAGWHPTSLYSIANWVNGLAFKDIHFSTQGKPVIKIAEIKNGITSQTQHTEGSYDGDIHITDGDMLFAWSGQPETSIGVSIWRGQDGWLNQHIFKVLPKEGMDRDFLYFLLMYLNPYFVRIAKNKQTTGLGHVTKEDLRSMRVGIPSLDEQRELARTILPLERKLELLRQQNETLEQIAQVIFNERFIKTVVEGHNLFSIADILSGGTPNTSRSEYYDGDIPFFTPKDARDTTYVLETEKSLTQAGLENCNSGLFKVNTVFITARGTVGKVAIAGLPMAMNQSCYALRAKNERDQYFLYLLLKQKTAELLGRAHGSVFQTITLDTFRTMDVPSLEEDVLATFGNTVAPLFQKILHNTKAIKTLSTIRDALLPRLMNGELTTSN